MSLRARRSPIVLGALTSIAATIVHAQQPAAELGRRPRTIVGVVTDTSGSAIDSAGGSVTFELVQRPDSLPLVVSTATRLGLSGVVGDTAYNIVAGASISVLASDRRTVSDSAVGR